MLLWSEDVTNVTRVASRQNRDSLPASCLWEDPFECACRVARTLQMRVNPWFRQLRRVDCGRTNIVQQPSIRVLKRESPLRNTTAGEATSILVRQWSFLLH